MCYYRTVVWNLRKLSVTCTTQWPKLWTFITILHHHCISTFKKANYNSCQRESLKQWPFSNTERPLVWMVACQITHKYSTYAWCQSRYICKPIIWLFQSIDIGTKVYFLLIKGEGLWNASLIRALFATVWWPLSQFLDTIK